MALNLVDGWTERIIYTLRINGAAADLTGKTVTLLAYGTDRQALTLGTVGVVSEVDGTVFLDPNLPNGIRGTNSPYNIRWKVTDSQGRSAFFPSVGNEVWTVVSY